MHGSITARCRRLTLVSAAALALTVVPYRVSLHGSAPGIDAVTAQAGKGGNGGGNNGNGNGNGGSKGGNSGNGNGNGNGNSGGGNNGNGNGNGGNSGNSGGNNGNGNSNSGNSGNSSGGNSGTDDGGGDTGSGKGQNDQGASHVNAATGDKVEMDGNKITVTHPDGITENIENGRFRMKDALGRTIIDRQATPADVSRLTAL